MKSEFNVGDVVQLKCGGPKMVVGEIMDGAVVKTYWINSTQSGVWAVFPSVTLKRAK